jgi:hypothetical protein
MTAFDSIATYIHIYIYIQRERVRQSNSTDGNINGYSRKAHASMYPWWVSSNSIDVKKHWDQGKEQSILSMNGMTQ